MSRKQSLPSNEKIIKRESEHNPMQNDRKAEKHKPSLPVLDWFFDLPGIDPHS